MIIINTSCSHKKSGVCSKKIIAAHPTVVSISHIDNKHLCIEKDDYNSNGMITQSIHKLCWKLGGIQRKRNNQVVKKPTMSKIELNLVRNAAIIQSTS